MVTFLVWIITAIWGFILFNFRNSSSQDTFPAFFEKINQNLNLINQSLVEKDKELECIKRSNSNIIDEIAYLKKKIQDKNYENNLSDRKNNCQSLNVEIYKI